VGEYRRPLARANKELKGTTMTRSTIDAEAIVEWDAMPSGTGHIETGINNAWKGPEICMWHEHFVCAGSDGWYLWLKILFERDCTLDCAHRLGTYGHILFYYDISVVLKKSGHQDISGFRFEDFSVLPGDYAPSYPPTAADLVNLRATVSPCFASAQVPRVRQSQH
jgi:hypothetical protein